MLSRNERTLISNWFWTIDRHMLIAFIALMFFGITFLMGGGPPVSQRIGLSTFYFINRQILYLFPAFALMMSISFLDLKSLRRLSILLWILSYVLCIIALIYGPLIKGAHRWLYIGAITIQPSELLKPTFIIVVAWMLSHNILNDHVLGKSLYVLMLPTTLLPIIMQPDFGQACLLFFVWCVIMFAQGLHWIWVIGFATFGLTGVGIALLSFSHVSKRILHYIHKNSLSYQEFWAHQAFLNGKWFGLGPGEGIAKEHLPDAHTDYLFSVIGEEYGIIICMIIVCVYCYIVLRCIGLALKMSNPFRKTATIGLAMLFGTQAYINIAVNVKLIPAKGMTLPFISYGGSSLLSTAFLAGALLVFTRRQPKIIEHLETIRSI